MVKPIDMMTEKDFRSLLAEERFEDGTEVEDEHLCCPTIDEYGRESDSVMLDKHGNLVLT